MWHVSYIWSYKSTSSCPDSAYLSFVGHFIKKLFTCHILSVGVELDIYFFFDFLKLWLINISIKLKTDLNNKPCIRLYQIQKSKATIHLPYNTWLLITNHSCGQYAVDLKLNLKSHEASVGLSDMFIFCKTVWLITEMWQQT